MPPRLPTPLCDEILARYPLPIADAVAALDAADNDHQRRDLVVQCFRAAVRYNACLALAVRLQYGPGDGDPGDLAELLRTLRRRHLTDGQWVQLTRSLLRPWVRRIEGHPLPELVVAICGKDGKRPPLVKAIDGLLEMRRAETVAHGGTGASGELDAVLARRLPQLAALLEGLGPVWTGARLAVPLARPDDPAVGPPHAGDEPAARAPSSAQRAWLLMGAPLARGRWRRFDLAAGVSLPPGEPVLIDPDDRPLVALHPVAMVRRPSPEVAEELFVLDGGDRRGARYVAVPSMAEHRVAELWTALEPILSGDDEAEPDLVEGMARPYRGLAAFTAAHAGLFYGRDREIDELANRLRRHPLVTVTGRSGSGKSSLLYAGVLPRLADDHVIVGLRPGPHPTRSLATRLDVAIDAEVAGLSPRSFAELLADAPETLGIVLERWARHTGRRVVLAIDQAEELFTLCEEPDERERFAAALASTGYDPDGPLRVVLALREDFFARLATLESLRGLYSRQVEVVTTPDREALIRTVVAPAARFGYQFEDPELVAAMVDPVVGEVGALALLQFCADQMWAARDRSWKRLTRAAYRDLGGVEGALAAHADRVIEAMTPAQQTAARRIFLHLVTEEDTRAVVPRLALLGYAGSRADAELVIDRLIDARLLTVREAEDGGDASAVEIVHETLIRHWQRLRGWLDQDHHLLAVRRRVASAAAHWDDAGRGRDFLLGDGKPILEAEELIANHSEMLSPREVDLVAASRARARRRARLARAAITGLAALAILAAGFGVFALRQRHQAQVRAAEAAQRSDDLVLLRAAETVERDPAEALAWLATLDLDRATAPRARLIAADAESRGVTTHMLRFPERAPPRIQLAEDHLVYLDATAHGFRQALDGGERRALTPPASHPISLDTRVEIDAEWHHVAINFDDAVELTDLAAGRTVTLPVSGHETLRAIPAAGGSAVALLDRQGALSVLEVASGQRRQIAAGPIHPASSMIAITGDGGLVVYVLSDGRGEIIDRIGGGRLEIAAPATAQDSANGLPINRFSKPVVAALSPDGRLLVIAGPGSLRLIATDSGRVSERELFALAPIESLAFARDGTHMITVHTDQTIGVWQMPAGAMMQKLHGGEAGLGAVAVSDDGARVASASPGGPIQVWDTASGDPVVLAGHRGEVTGLDFADGGDRLASTSLDGDLRVWQLPRASRRRIEVGLLSGFDSLRFNRAGELVATTDASLWIWSRDGERVARWSADPDGGSDPFAIDLPALDGNDRTLAADPDGARAVSLGGERVELWTRAASEARPLIKGRFHHAAFAADGRIALYGDYDPSIPIVDASGHRLAELRGGAAVPGDFPRLRTVAFSPDDRWLIEVDEIGTVRQWRTDDWTPTLLGKELGALRRPALSPDSRRLAVPSGDQILVFGLVDGSRVTLSGHHKRVEAVAFAPDGDTLASFSADETVRLWDLPRGDSRILAGARGPLGGGVFSADGATLATLRWDGVIHIWDLQSGQSRALVAPAARITAIALSDDGDLVAGAGDGGAIYQWPRDLPRAPDPLERRIAAATRLRLDPITNQLAATPAVP